MKLSEMMAPVEEDGDDEVSISYESESGASEIVSDHEGSENEVVSESETQEARNVVTAEKRKLEGSPDRSRKKRKASQNDLLKPPTVKELNRLRETQNLFHSNIFRLQIEEMLKEVKVKAKYVKLLSNWFENLKCSLEQIEESEKYDLTNQKWLKKLKVRMPLIPNLVCNKGIFQFLRPASISLIGSWRLQCCVGPDVTVDLNVEMPQACFLKTDYLNQRYHQKRALYLAYLASYLQESDLLEEVMFHTWCGNTLKPVLKLKPAGKLSKHVTVLLHLSAESTSLKMTRFSPSKNNVRQSWYFGDSDGTDSDAGTPTPHYNSSIARDVAALSYNDYLVQLLETHSNIRDGIVLLKVWLRQRELDQGFGGFSGFIMTMYVAYLLNMRRLNNSMSSYQIARYVWNSLAQADWVTNGISLTPADADNVPTLSEYHEHYEVVFVDISGFCNICADMTKETFQMVKSEAELAIKFLDSNSVNSFQVLFMTRMPFYRQYDHIFCVRDMESVVSTQSPKSKQLDWLGQVRPLALALILPLIRRALGSRVLLLGVSLGASKTWNPRQKPPLDEPHLVFGLRLNPSHAYSILDRGPEANVPEAEDFRKFWGSKSELRRFQDGGIAEAVVWKKGATLSDKRVICRLIVEHILNMHLQIDPTSSITYIADQVESVLQSRKIKPAEFEYGTGEEATLAVLSSYDGLTKQLRQLKDLPLEISTVQGNSAVFRYCEVFPPLSTTHKLQRSTCADRSLCYIFLEDSPHKHIPRWVLPVEVVIILAASGKWPNDIEAVRRIRAAFNIKISQCLHDQFNLAAQPYQDYVDILKDGFVFRLRIACTREIALLKEMTTPLGVRKYRDTPQSLALEKKVVHSPKLTSALHGLHQEYPSYGPTTCLAKRWLSSQMLDDSHMPAMAVELIVASLYSSPGPYQPPQQPQCAFFRFLHRLAYTDWHMEPLIVNINNELDNETVTSVDKHFHNARKSLPPLFIATPGDTVHSVWTKEAPSLAVLVHVTSLAVEALKVIEEQLSTFSLHYQALFSPALDFYDVVIYLHPSLISRRSESLQAKVDKEPSKLPPYKPQQPEKIPIVGFDPVQCYLRELRQNYGEYALFFHDTYGGDVIGVLWKPTAKEQKEFKVSNVRGHKLVNSESSQIIPNIEAFSDDFLALGSGLVKSVKQKCMQ
ncbi:nucleolar protein 6 [Schistocerca serialis cubense]|uniref:nucleolar protein 6 n=1 Tax=Schistocerca serialis cubense TaxID=2023355 RepID=UPI00214F51BB|nr:nucleolar protein 6 [Schistocerca serialis cubense]